MPITRGSTPATALPTNAPSGSTPSSRAFSSRRDHERGGAVVDARCVAGRDRAARAERGLQRGELLGGRVGPRVLVARRRRRPGRARRRSGRPRRAAAQRRCDSSANASWSSRETPQRSATFSPVSPIDSSGNSSSSCGFGKRQPSVVSYSDDGRRARTASSGFGITNGARRHRLDAARDEEVAVARDRPRGRRRRPPRAPTRRAG